MKFKIWRQIKQRYPRLSRLGNYILVFLNGFFLALIFYFLIEDNYEKQLFKALATVVRNEVDKKNVPEEHLHDSLLVQSLHLVHQLESSRANVFGGVDVNGFKAQLIQPVTYDLMTGKQACGGFSYVLGRLLKEFNTDVRFAQMKVNGYYGGHILIEAETSKGWKVLDPSYDLFFKKTNSELAGFQDISKNWDWYKAQVPPNYNLDYKYDGVRYTNWDKIPVIMPIAKWVVSMFVGKKEAEYFSFRNLVLRKYYFLLNVTIIVYLLLILYTIRKVLRHKH